MRSIQKLAHRIHEELEDAQRYAECYVEKKAAGKTQQSSSYKKMADDELQHAAILHEFAVAEIEQLKTVFKAPADMQDKWDAEHREYVAKAAWVKQMLSM